MRSKVIKRFLLGILVGISIGNIMSIIYSVIYANGYYGVVTPELVVKMGNEINAVIINTILWGIIGAIYCSFSVVWEIEKWSMLKKIIIVFSAYIITIMSIGLILDWFTFALIDMAIFIIVFTSIFLLIWIISYKITKKETDMMNEKIKKR